MLDRQDGYLEGIFEFFSIWKNQKGSDLFIEARKEG